MSVEVLNKIHVDPEIEEEARREGRLVGEAGESFAHTNAEGNDVSGHTSEIGFRFREQEIINIRFKDLIEKNFGNSSPDTSLEW